jgi:hypothetical protein
LKYQTKSIKIKKLIDEKMAITPDMILGWSPFKMVSVSAVLFPRWPPLLKIEISSNGQNCTILSQKLSKFELYQHNELLNIYYGIFYELWTFAFWKGTTQGSYRQSLVEIGSVVSEEKILSISFPLFSNLHNRSKSVKVQSS